MITDNEQTVLSKCGWISKQLGYYGTLIHNVADMNGRPITDVICRRDNKGITVDWLVPNQEGERITLTFDRFSDSFDFTKSDPEIKNSFDAEHFLDNIENITRKSSPSWFPKGKVLSNQLKPIT